MRRTIVGLVIGLVLGLSIPAVAHRDGSISKHLYNHIHNVAHRLIDVETVVWKDLPGFLTYLTGDGVYVGPYGGTVKASQVRIDPECVDKYAIWRSDGQNIKLTCEVAPPTATTTTPAPPPATSRPGQ